MNKKNTVINQIEKIYELMYEQQKCLSSYNYSIIKNQERIFDKLDKLQEYNTIDDMNNAIVDQRLININEMIQKMQIE